jgi:hypothetical protein
MATRTDIPENSGRLSTLSLLLAAILPACAWFPSSPSMPIENDPSVIFPQFFERDPIDIGAQDTAYELDGETLKALAIATNDFLPAATPDMPCWRRREAQLYRIIWRQNIIFIYIHENHVYCGRAYPAMDSGVKYAISTDGRILRRIIDGQEGGPFDIAAPKRSDAGFTGELGTSPAFEALYNHPAVSEHSDGGIDGGVLSSSVGDGGASAPP